MDLQTILDNAVKAKRAEELKNSPQLLLGEMILKLEAVKNKELPLFIDIMDKRPKGIDSWRGVYAELAIQTEDLGSYQGEVEKDYGDFQSHKQISIGKENPTVAEWIKVLKEAIGKTFTGYKGGDFLMGKGTPVYLAEYGNSSFKTDDKEIDDKDYSNYKTVHFIDVREEKDKVYLVTAFED
ncbi:MAG: hypothetical protein Q8L27_03000 [archaeon]|nr:hypothetical protein [archaeon]